MKISHSETVLADAHSWMVVYAGGWWVVGCSVIGGLLCGGTLDSRRCPPSLRHSRLQGTNSSGVNKTVAASVYPRKYCGNITTKRMYNLRKRVFTLNITKAGSKTYRCWHKPVKIFKL